MRNLPAQCSRTTDDLKQNLVRTTAMQALLNHALQPAARDQCGKLVGKRKGYSFALVGNPVFEELPISCSGFANHQSTQTSFTVSSSSAAKSLASMPPSDAGLQERFLGLHPLRFILQHSPRDQTLSSLHLPLDTNLDLAA